MPQVKKENPQIHLSPGMTQKDILTSPLPTMAGASPTQSATRFSFHFSVPRKNGNGIGLSISREIVKLHNGKLHVQSQEKEGSAFTILFSP